MRLKLPGVTDAERQKLRDTKLATAQRQVSLYLNGAMYTGNPNLNKVAKRRAKNKLARRSRRANRK